MSGTVPTFFPKPSKEDAEVLMNFREIEKRTAHGLMYGASPFSIQMAIDILSFIEKELNKEKKPLSKYSFHVPNEAYIDYGAIIKDLDKRHPVAVIDAGEDFFDVFVHHNLYRKSKELGMNCPVEGGKYLCVGTAKFSTVFFVQTPKKKLGALLTWVKAVKSAPWGEKKNPKEVKVHFPKI